MVWEFLRFDLDGRPGAKSHVVPGTLTDGIRDDVVGRMKGARVVVKRSVIGADQVVDFDLGGIAIASRPTIDMDVDGVRLKIPCQDVTALIGQIHLARPRPLPSGAAYVKIHGFHKALVLTPMQALQVQTHLLSLEKAANEDHDAFYEAWAAQTHAQAAPMKRLKN